MFAIPYALQKRLVSSPISLSRLRGKGKGNAAKTRALVL